MKNGHFKDSFYYIEDLKEINNGAFDQVSADNVPENTVDTKCTEVFKSLGLTDKEIRHQSTRIDFIDKNIPSKNSGSKERGFADIYIIQNEQLKVLVEDKIPTVPVETALEEAIFYCNALRSKGIDIRIAIGYNGKKLLFRVFTGLDESGKNTWNSFYFNGEEYRQFPSKDIISLIYNYTNLKGILEDRSPRSKKIVHSSIEQLRGYYRQLAFIQNDNTTTIDFTIAFISLKSISEKHSNLFEDSNHIWGNLLPKGETEAAANPLIRLQNNISGLVEWLCDKEKQFNKYEERENLGTESNVNLYNFNEIFQYKTKDRNFNFKSLIKEFKTTNLKKLQEIYEVVNDMPELHSSKIDLFGEIYELLADKKTKSSFGQFFTGRHIIKPLIKLLFEENKSIKNITGEISENGIVSNPKKICDPACGTGGFLTEAFKYIDNELKEEGISLNINDFASKTFFGFDIHSQNTTKTKINMYLAGDGFSEIKDRDSLTEMPLKYMDYFDYIITNPPYGDNSPVIDSSIINSQRLEINFIIQIVKMLKAGGKALLVIPDGVLESPSIAHFRDWLLRQCQIDKIIGLPKFAFAPYTKEKTYALFITKRKIPIVNELEQIQNEEIWFYIVDNDGFANSDKRFATNRKTDNGKWLHDELNSWVDSEGIEHKSMLESAWENKEQDEQEKYFNEWGVEIEGKKYGRVKLKEIFKNEFVYYPTIAKSEIKKIINTLPDIADLSEKDLNNISVRKVADTYFDLDNPKHRNLTIKEIKDLFSSVKNKKDLLTEEGSLIDTFSIDNSIYGYEIKESESGFNIDIWKHEEDTYKEIKENVVISKYKVYLIEQGAFINELTDLLDEEGNVKEQFIKIFEENNIYYDVEEDKFYDHFERMSKKLLYLIPEKYFREKEIETVNLETFKKENDSLIENIKSDLNELLGGL
ncbi:HsdM family class I SAM-dependent methyltransferase [Aliarcobacter butzleri]|uniref:HsdM family class I SAM-dependent methyltransferase n=1 Tax=Aliarcobacter butzleri TaxID=28197 RepID=UPI00263E914C|nr:N-6 DNA methylase [Aliarcobacter butzleri]MDN5095175.1 N-6 DNA methylase [Aliarcobacter butzleri]